MNATDNRATANTAHPETTHFLSSISIDEDTPFRLIAITFHHADNFQSCKYAGHSIIAPTMRNRIDM